MNISMNGLLYNLDVEHQYEWHKYIYIYKYCTFHYIVGTSEYEWNITPSIVTHSNPQTDRKVMGRILFLRLS